MSGRPGAMTDAAEHKLDPDPSEAVATGLAEAMVIDPEEQLATRAAWLYFVAGLTQIDVRGVDFVALVFEPSQKHGGIESTRISQNAG